MADITMVMTGQGLKQVSYADCSGSMPAAAMPAGVPQQSVAVNLLLQAAAIGSTILLAVLTTGYYRIGISIKRTQAATTSSTLPSVAIAWTEGDNSAAGSVTPVATNATNTLVAAAVTEVVVYAKAGTNINYTCAGYASSGVTPMQFALHLNCEKL